MGGMGTHSPLTRWTVQSDELLLRDGADNKEATHIHIAARRLALGSRRECLESVRRCERGRKIMFEFVRIIEKGINDIRLVAWIVIVLFIFCIVATIVEHTTKTLHKEDDE